MVVIYDKEPPTKKRNNGAKKTAYWARKVSYYTNKGQDRTRFMRVENDNHLEFRAKFMKKAHVALDKDHAYDQVMKMKSKGEPKRRSAKRFLKKQPKVLRKTYRKKIRQEDGTYKTITVTRPVKKHASNEPVELESD